MGTTSYICLNGEFLKAGEPRLFANNRAFRYNDFLCENIHALATTPQFLTLHLERLFKNMQLLLMEIPAYFSEANFRMLIASLLNKNKTFGGACIRLSVFRSEGETLIPESDKVSFMIESHALKHDKYVVNDKGLLIDISDEHVKLAGKFSGLYTGNTLLFLMASLESKQRNLDDVILLNQAGRITETCNSNIFLLSGHAIFTPGVNQGCIPGIMRKVLIDLAIKEGYTVNDQSSLTTAALHDAEEILLTNAVDGIRWVGAYQQTRYYNKAARLLTLRLNESAFPLS